LFLRGGGQYVLTYRDSSSATALKQRYSQDGELYQAVSSIATISFNEIATATISDEKYIMVYLKTSDNHIAARTRSITPVTATVTGDYDTPISVTFTGPSTNPRIVNADTIEYIRLDTTLATGDTFVANTAFGQKTVTLTQGGIVKNGTAFLDIGSTFFQLTPGSNTVYFEDDAVASTATASMTWTERYVGI
jgi:hypothetical protein